MRVREYFDLDNIMLKSYLSLFLSSISNKQSAVIPLTFITPLSRERCRRSWSVTALRQGMARILLP